MKVSVRIASALVLAGAVVGFAATAETNPSVTIMPQMSRQDPCRDQVAKFEQSMALVRVGVGNAKGAEFKEKLLPAVVEENLLATEGYCGLATYLRGKRLID